MYNVIKHLRIKLYKYQSRDHSTTLTGEEFDATGIRSGTVSVNQVDICSGHVSH